MWPWLFFCYVRSVYVLKYCQHNAYLYAELDKYMWQIRFCGDFHERFIASLTKRDTPTQGHTPMLAPDNHLLIPSDRDHNWRGMPATDSNHYSLNLKWTFEVNDMHITTMDLNFKWQLRQHRWLRQHKNGVISTMVGLLYTCHLWVDPDVLWFCKIVLIASWQTCI